MGRLVTASCVFEEPIVQQLGLTIQAHFPKFSIPSRYVVPFTRLPTRSCSTFIFHPNMSLALSCMSFRFSPFHSLCLAIFSLHYPAAHGPHPAAGPAPGPVHLYHHARAHALVTLSSGPAAAFTPWARLTLLPRALTSAHPQSSITSPPHFTPPRRPHPHRSPHPSRDALFARHDSLRPPASSGRSSRTNHDSAQPNCAQWSRSRLPRTGVAGPAPGPTAADLSGATRLALPLHHHSSCDRDKHTPRPLAASARFALLSLATGTGRLSRVRMTPLS